MLRSVALQAARECRRTYPHPSLPGTRACGTAVLVHLDRALSAKSPLRQHCSAPLHVWTAHGRSYMSAAGAGHALLARADSFQGARKDRRDGKAEDLGSVDEDDGLVVGAKDAVGGRSKKAGAALAATDGAVIDGEDDEGATSRKKLSKEERMHLMQKLKRQEEAQRVLEQTSKSRERGSSGGRDARTSSSMVPLILRGPTKPGQFSDLNAMKSERLSIAEKVKRAFELRLQKEIDAQSASEQARMPQLISSVGFLREFSNGRLIFLVDLHGKLTTPPSWKPPGQVLAKESPTDEERALIKKQKRELELSKAFSPEEVFSAARATGSKVAIVNEMDDRVVLRCIDASAIAAIEADVKKNIQLIAANVRKKMELLDDQKEVQLTAFTDENDFQTVIRKSRRFLESGHAVSVHVIHRNGPHKFDRGAQETMMKRVMDALRDIGDTKPENFQLKATSMTCLFLPKDIVYSLPAPASAAGPSPGDSAEAPEQLGGDGADSGTGLEKKTSKYQEKLLRRQQQGKR